MIVKVLYVCGCMNDGCMCLHANFFLSLSLTLLSSFSVRVSVAVDIQTFQRASFYDNVSGLHEAPGES